MITLSRVYHLAYNKGIMQNSSYVLYPPSTKKTDEPENIIDESREVFDMELN